MTSTNTRMRQHLVEQFGGKCERCGYDKCNRALHFHHRDSSEKRMWNKHGRVSNKEVRQYPERFILLCSNCHAEIHDEEYKNHSIHTKCKFCGKAIQSQPARVKSGQDKFCNRKCFYAYQSEQSKSPDVIQKRLQKFIVKEHDHWIWTGTMLRGISPILVIKNEKGGFSPISVPRLIYQFHISVIPKRKQVLRTCREPRCVNPAHLTLSS